MIRFGFILTFAVLFLFSKDIESLKKEDILHTAVRSGDISLVNELISNNVYLNTKDKFGNTPLHLAVRANNLEMVKILLDQYVNVNSKNIFDNTPLLDAVKNHNQEIVKELVCVGAKLNVDDNTDKTPLEYVIKNNDKSILPIFEKNFKEKKCGIKLSFDKFDYTKDRKVCGKILRGKVDKIVFFILDTDNNTLIDSSNAKINKNTKQWCAKTNILDSLRGNYEIVINGFGEGKRDRTSYKFNIN